MTDMVVHIMTPETGRYSKRVACLFIVVTTLLGGCYSTEYTSDAQQAVNSTSSSQGSGSIALVSEAIHSVQLYAAGDQASMPVIMRGGADKLTLSFDQLGVEPRNFRVFFQHADRNWKSDLLPVQFMEKRQEDEILDYTLSSLTDVDYIHYRYDFPNEEVGFKISGNYLIRVTDYDDESRVFVEMPFMISEEIASTRLQIDRLIFGDSAWPLQQPVLDVRPPAQLEQDIFNFFVCFVQNGRLESRRCPERPYLASIPDLQFKLEPEDAYPIEGDIRILDLTHFETGGDIVYVDKSAVPYEIDLVVDYPELPTGRLAGGNWGKSVYGTSRERATRSRMSGEYAEVNFSLEPPRGTPFNEEVTISGSFDNWTSSYTLEWNSNDRIYETTLLLKQGLHYYTYQYGEEYWSDNRSRPILNTEQLFDAFVYYRDDFLATDRLIARSSVRSR